MYTPKEYVKWQASLKAKGKDRIFLPGEMEWEKRESATTKGEIEITDAHADALKALSDKNGIAINIIEE